MTKPLLVLIMMFLPWLPWTEEAMAIMEESKAIAFVFPEETWGGRGMCCGPKPDIRVSKYCAPQDIPMVVLHETQHLLPFLYGMWDWSNAFSQWDGWDGFKPRAMACVRKANRSELKAAIKYAGFGPWELHAQLPWLLKGKLCPNLQPWYPWFELDEKTTSGPHSSPIHRHSHLQ